MVLRCRYSNPAELRDQPGQLVDDLRHTRMTSTPGMES